jgi:O-antigen ligase
MIMNKQTLRFIVLAGLFLVPFIPFLVSSSLFFPFITTKAFAWRFIIEIVFAAWILLALLDPEQRPRKSPILYAVLAFLAVIGVASIFSFDPARSFWSNFERMEGYVSLLHLGAFFLVISSVLVEKDWKRWWNTSLVAAGLMVLYSMAQLGGLATINQGGVRVDGTFGNASYLAVYMLIHVFIASLFMWREWRSSALRYSYAALILGEIFILYHTATRGAILGLLGGLFIVALLNFRNKEEKRVRRLSTAILATLVIVGGGFFLLKDTGLVKNSPVLSRFSTISTEELKSGGRSFVWPMALKGFQERPILGWGQENFVYVFQKHYSPEMYRLEPWFDRAHNIFLDWAVAGGILGLLAYLSLYIVLIYLVWWRDNNLEKIEKSILTGLVGAYFFHNLFVFDHLVSYILFFAILGYVHQRNSQNLLWDKSFSRGVVNNLALPLVTVLLVSTIYFVNIKPIGTNLSLINAFNALRTPGQLALAADEFEKSYGNSWLGSSEVSEQVAQNALTILNSDISLERKNQFFTFAKDLVTSEAARSPQNAKQQLVAGSLLAATGDSGEAIMYLERARDLSPGKQQVYFEIGSAHINNKQFDEALRVFREAYEMAPEYSEAKIIYLIGAIYAGDRNIEREIASKLSEQEFVFEERIISAYYLNKRFPEVVNILERRKALNPANASQYDEYIKQIRNLQ